MKVLVTGGAGSIGRHAVREVPAGGGPFEGATGFTPAGRERDALVETVVRWRRGHPRGYAAA